MSLFKKNRNEVDSLETVANLWRAEKCKKSSDA